MQQTQTSVKKTGRNDPCPCGSGRKHKHCCQLRTATQTPAEMLQQAMDHHQAGRLPEAESLYRNILQAAPEHPDALHLLGLIAHQVGKPDIALDLIRRALVRKPDDAGALCNLGVVEQSLGRLDVARDCFRYALVIQPDYAEAHNNLGMVLLEQGDAAAARGYFDRALALRPDYAEAHNNLGRLLHEQGDPDAALDCFRHALSLRPDYAEARSNEGVVLLALGRLDAAVASLEQALVIRPGDADAHYNLSHALLLRGDFELGWREYEWRVHHWTGSTQVLDPRNPSRVLPRPSTLLPLDLSGQRIQLVREQGIGDELFFLRFASLARQRGAWLAYQPSEKIATLVERAPGLDAVLHGDMRPASLDQILLVGDLPLVLGADHPEEFPPALSLTVLPVRQAALKSRLAALGGRPLLGVTWRAGSKRSTTHRKSILYKETDIAQLGYVLSAWPGEVLILQRHPQPEEIEIFEHALGRSTHDWSAFNESLEDMLALLGELDEYVGVSNTNMHLMAGLGKTARVLVTNPPEWRWMQAGDSSPWFPGFRLYRQGLDGDWSGALDRLGKDLQDRGS